MRHSVRVERPPQLVCLLVRAQGCAMSPRLFPVSRAMPLSARLVRPRLVSNRTWMYRSRSYRWAHHLIRSGLGPAEGGIPPRRMIDMVESKLFDTEPGREARMSRLTR